MPPMPSGKPSRPPRRVHMWRMPIARCCSWRRPGGGDAETSRTKCKKRSVLARVCRIGPWHFRRQQEQQQQQPPQQPQDNNTGTPALQGPGRFRRKGKQRQCSSRRGGGGCSSRNSSSKLESIPEESEAQDDLRVLFFPDLWTACRALNLDREQVSQRGSSSMYRGTMDPDDQAVSVRILSRDLGPDSASSPSESSELEAEAWLAWLGDVRRVSAIHHLNWVKLLAYCLVEKSNHHMLVYEALPGTSLHSRLADRRLPPVPWPARMKIAVGAARCLANLHQQEASWWCCDHPQQRPKLLCGTLNAHTVLLDRAYSPKLFFVKLSDEWPLRFTITDDTPAAQTAFRRYLRAHFCKEMDVFNFGLLLLHLLAGGRHKKKGASAVDWANGGRSRKLSAERVTQLVDKRLRGRYSTPAAKEVAALALRCVSPEDHERPSMCEVVLGMERAQTMS